jgi:DNA-binding XRE family transcriptional regulator
MNKDLLNKFKKMGAVTLEEHLKKYSKKNLEKINKRADEIIALMKLRKRREELGLSQYELEEASGVSRRTIIQIEKGRRIPNLETLFQLSDSLKMQISIDFYD